jgi:hypothetical protein
VVWDSLALRGDDSVLRFDLDRLVVEDGELEWVENLQGFSGSGLLHNSQSSLQLTRVHFDAQPVRGIADERPFPTRFTLEARVGDGEISAEGSANFFRWIPSAGAGSAEPAISTATARDGPAGVDPLVWSPAIDVTVALNGFGAGAFGQVAPDAAIVPRAGTMFGSIRVVLDRPRFECHTDLVLTDVEFAVNRDSPVMVGRVDRVSDDLGRWRANRRVDVGCDGSLDRGRPHQVVQAAITRGATADAPPDVQRIAAYEEARFETDPVTDAAVAALQREVAARLGDPAAAALFTPDEESGETPAAHGVRKLGRRIKNVFTRGDRGDR